MIKSHSVLDRDLQIIYKSRSQNALHILRRVIRKLTYSCIYTAGAVARAFFVPVRLIDRIARLANMNVRMSEVY